MIITLHHPSWSSHYKTFTYHFHDQMSTNTALLSSLLETRVLKEMEAEHQHIVTQLPVYTETYNVLTMHASFFLGFPMYSGGITWIHVYICVSGGWGGIGVSAGIFPLYIIISVICYPCLATCTYTSLFLVIIHQQKHQCLQIPGIWCIKCVPIHHMFSC